MKKGLLLSVVASGILFAGGDIAPVQPVVPAAAPASCDFWGSLGARYEFIKDSASADSWGKKDNTWKTALVLGVEKKLGYGFGFGAELGAYSHLGLTDIATNTANRAEISQLYLTYKTGNTAFKAGRQALPKTLSPWAWSDRTVGVLDRAFNGLVVVNTDLANTTLVGAWIASVTDTTSSIKISDNSTNKGLFMVAAEYTGVANTTLDVSAYYVPKFFSANKAYSIWASGKTKVNNLDLGLQLAYAKQDGSKATVGAAGYVGTTFGNIDAKLTVAYIKDGGTTLNLGGTSGFWGNVAYSNFGGDIINPTDGAKQKIAKLDVGYKLPNNYGKLYAGVAYDDVSDSTVLDKSLAARLGYSFKVSGINAKIEYRYTKNTPVSGSARKIQKVRVEGIYKF